jgi:DNA-binding response OmpR family regulator
MHSFCRLPGDEPDGGQWENCLRVPMPAPLARLLIVEDDVEAAAMMVEYLSAEGFAVDHVATAHAGLQQALAGEYALLILDIMLPDGNGFDLLRSLRKESQLCVLVLSARGDGVDRVRGLEAGADDYLSKPYLPQELVARINAILRRSRSGGEAHDAGSLRLGGGDLLLDLGARLVMQHGRPVPMTATEFTLLSMLLRRAGNLVTREDLSPVVLGRPYTPSDRSIDNLVSALRRKLGPLAQDVDRIQSVRGLGYVFRLTETMK